MKAIAKTKQLFMVPSDDAACFFPANDVKRGQLPSRTDIREIQRHVMADHRPPPEWRFVFETCQYAEILVPGLGSVVKGGLQ